MGIREFVYAVQARQQRQWIWQCLSLGLVGGGFVGCVLATIRLAISGTLPWTWIVGSLIAGPVIGLLVALLRPSGQRDAAVAIDRSSGLKDRVATALNFIEGKENSPIHQLQISDARARVASVDPARVAPIVTPRSWLLGLGLSCVALVIGYLSIQSNEAVAEIVSNDVVVLQADRVALSLEELKEFNREEVDPEIEKLLRELAKKIEELKQPGLDPKEALAKLSEMEAALREQQEQLTEQNAEAALQEVGEALSLAEPFEAAGQAMAAGDMEKSAEELEKLEFPELDRKTEKAVEEKLNQAKENAGNGSKRKKLKNAVAKMAEGLGKGNRSKFKDGVEGLCSECKKQGRRKKLSDLLRKQCQCLGDCKGECESECKNAGQGKGKGGDNWGLGKSGNDPGDKTAKLKTGPQMQIKGQESGDGDIDIETMESAEQQQEAVREYKKQAQKYEQLSESVLSSEPIPLGHRQTIRRYFEMIRPQAGETDKVNELTDEPQKK